MSAAKLSVTRLNALRMHGAHLLSALALASLVACGGGGDAEKPATPSSIKGTVATGAAVSGTVTVKDSTTLERSFPINSDGSYTIDTTGMEAPLLLRAEGRVGDKQIILTAPVTEADLNGTVNITPLSDLLVANLAQGAASAFFSAPNFSKLNTTEINNALADLKRKLQPILDAAGLSNVNFLRDSFTANHTGLDGLLDVLEITIDGGTATIVSKTTGDKVIDDLSKKGTDDATQFTLSDANKQIIQTTTGDSAKTKRLSDLQATIDTLNSIFAFGIEADEKPKLKALCDTSRFLDSDSESEGASCDSVVNEWANDPRIRNKRLSIARVVAFDANQPRAIDDTKTASGNITDDNVGLLLNDNQGGELDTAIWFTKNNGKWQFAGDQRVVDISIRGFAYRSGNINAQGQAVYNTPVAGVQFLLDKHSTISYAVVKGVGLPANGLTLVSPNTVGQTYMGISGNSETNLYQGMTVMPQPSDTYEVRLYGVNNQLLGTYQERMRSTAVPTSSSVVGKFANITQHPTKITCKSGNVNLAWTLPTGSTNEFVSADCINSNDFNDTEGELEMAGSSSTSATLAMSGTVDPATSATALVEIRDASGIEYMTQLFIDFSSTVEPVTPPTTPPTTTPSAALLSTNRTLLTSNTSPPSGVTPVAVDATLASYYQQNCTNSGLQGIYFPAGSTVTSVNASALVGKSFRIATCNLGNPAEDLLTFNTDGTVSDFGDHGTGTVNTIPRSSSDIAAVFSSNGSTEPGSNDTTYLQAYKVTVGGVDKFFIANYETFNGAASYFGLWQEYVAP